MQVGDISWLAACNCHVQIKPQNQAAAAQQATTVCFSHISHAFFSEIELIVIFLKSVFLGSLHFDCCSAMIER